MYQLETMLAVIRHFLQSIKFEKLANSIISGEFFFGIFFLFFSVFWRLHFQKNIVFKFQSISLLLLELIAVLNVYDCQRSYGTIAKLSRLRQFLKRFSRRQVPVYRDNMTYDTIWKNVYEIMHFMRTLIVRCLCSTIGKNLKIHNWEHLAYKEKPYERSRVINFKRAFFSKRTKKFEPEFYLPPMASRRFPSGTRSWPLRAVFILGLY